MTLLYLLITVFPKFDPLTETGMALFVILGQNVKIFEIEFSLAWDYKQNSQTNRNNRISPNNGMIKNIFTKH
jgi:hypothetical protein